MPENGSWDLTRSLRG